MKEKKVSLERFWEVVKEAERRNKFYSLILTPVEVTGVHGAIALAMKHPKVKQDLTNIYPVLQDVRRLLCRNMVTMGFTEEEVEWLDRAEE